MNKNKKNHHIIDDLHSKKEIIEELKEKGTS